jgi:hypothetical protein
MSVGSPALIVATFARARSDFDQFFDPREAPAFDVFS